MTTAVIGTGGIGSVIARQLASGGETLRLSSADTESARTLAAQIGRAAVAAAGSNRDAVQGAGAVVLALRLTVLKGVIDEIAGPLAGKLPAGSATPSPRTGPGRVSPSGRCPGTGRARWPTSTRAPARAFTGVGHNLPPEAPRAFAQAATEVDGF
jgi:8-hydroxy-5-deazaflavin:NADPH oxidoreductase